MSFEDIFKQYNLEEDFECFTEDFFLNKNMGEIKLSLDHFIGNPSVRGFVLNDIRRLKDSKKSDSNKIDFQRDSILKLLSSTKPISGSKLVKDFKNLLKEDENSEPFDADLFNEDIKKLIEDDLISQTGKGNGFVYKLKDSSKKKFLNEISLQSKTVNVIVGDDQSRIYI